MFPSGVGRVVVSVASVRLFGSSLFGIMRFLGGFTFVYVAVVVATDGVVSTLVWFPLGKS